jgi:hypothetical protein
MHKQSSRRLEVRILNPGHAIHMRFAESIFAFGESGCEMYECPAILLVELIISVVLSRP